MDKVRVGIIGIGSMGSNHFRTLHKGDVPGAEVTAVCDTNPKQLAWAQAQGLTKEVCFEQADAFFAQAPVDAVLIATPHYDHPPLAIRALKQGWHALIEKPAGVYTRQVHELNAVAADAPSVFGIMLNQRTLAIHRKIKDLIDAGELGALQRVTWQITHWFRSQAYYDGGGWRATWSGEGGGALLNQCPHQLDLLQWFCGLPTKVRAFCAFGKHHKIEVEDDVTAYFEYANGATGVFITSTGEAPGTNRLEIVGTQGQLVMENGTLTFHRNRVPCDEFLQTTRTAFGKPECWTIPIPLDKDKVQQHTAIMRNWIGAILRDEPLVAPGAEGINSLQLSNAMLLSAWTDSTVALPVDDNGFYEALQARIRASNVKKDTAPDSVADLSDSFA